MDFRASGTLPTPERIAQQEVKKSLRLNATDKRCLFVRAKLRVTPLLAHSTYFFFARAYTANTSFQDSHPPNSLSDFAPLGEKTQIRSLMVVNLYKE